MRESRCAFGFFLGVVAVFAGCAKAPQPDAPPPPASSQSLSETPAESGKDENFAWFGGCAGPIEAASPGANVGVATSRPEATTSALRILRSGGNAVDAAISAALVLAVVEPANSGLGGGGFALVREPKSAEPRAFDFRERAPLGLDVAALRALLEREPQALRHSAHAVAVPAEWEGLVELRRRYGSQPLAALTEDAVRFAEEGFLVNPEYTARCVVVVEALRKNTETKRLFLDERGECLRPGARVVQRELAETLRRLGRGESFRSVVGDRMVAHLRTAGSPMTEADLAAISVRERAPVVGEFAGRRIVSMPPPSSGGILVVGILQTYEEARRRLPEAPALHLWTQVSRAAFFDRARFLGDPAFAKVPVERLTSRSYAESLAARLDAALPLDLPSAVPPADESQHTTHLSVVDASGMAVAMTLTINVPFGAALIPPGTGVLLNNQMDDFFVARPNSFGLVGNENNAPAPGKIPLSSMAPTMVFRGAELEVVLGSPGGSGIPSAVAQVLRNRFEGTMSFGEAVRAGRVHHQWQPDELSVEPFVDRRALPRVPGLRVVEPRFPIGRVQLVARGEEGIVAASDCRDQGLALVGRVESQK